TGEQYRTIQEAGKPAQKCLVMDHWRTADGHKAIQLKSLDTGEIMTIVETGPAQPVPGSTVRQLASRIFHWGRNTTPPPGVPLPPTDMPAVEAPRQKLGERIGERVKEAITNLIPPKNPPATQIATLPALPKPPDMPPIPTPPAMAVKPTVDPTPLHQPMPPRLATGNLKPSLPGSRTDQGTDRLASPEMYTRPVLDGRAPASATASDGGARPSLGSRSVMDSAKGGTPSFVPVPTMVVPHAKPPQPPPAPARKAPTPPNPTRYANPLPP